MKQFQNILLVLDEPACQQHALAQAALLAQENQARLTVLSVIPELPRQLRGGIELMRPILIGDPDKAALRKRRSELLRCVEPVRRQGIPGETKVLLGDAAQEILRAVREGGYDLVVLPAEPKRGRRRRLLGSAAVANLLGFGTAEKLLERMECSLLISA